MYAVVTWGGYATSARIVTELLEFCKKNVATMMSWTFWWKTLKRLSEDAPSSKARLIVAPMIYWSKRRMTTEAYSISKPVVCIEANQRRPALEHNGQVAIWASLPPNRLGLSAGATQNTAIQKTYHTYGNFSYRRTVRSVGKFRRNEGRCTRQRTTRRQITAIRVCKAVVYKCGSACTRPVCKVRSRNVSTNACKSPPYASSRYLFHLEARCNNYSALTCPFFNRLYQGRLVACAAKLDDELEHSGTSHNHDVVVAQSSLLPTWNLC